MTVRAPVRPQMLVWARERSLLAPDYLHGRFKHLAAWEEGTRQPTFKQLEEFALATHTPIGYLFLPEPPDEPLPLPDFRTIGDVAIGRPSPDLLDTIYQCEQRQDWYRDYARLNQEEPLSFVGSLAAGTDVVTAAGAIRNELRFGPDERGASWADAFRLLRDAADVAGVLVMVNGVVGNNTHRRLDPKEFRGFTLVDDYAPVVFVNGTDTKAAQIFTLAHELVHVWIGESALSDADMLRISTNDVERWCNQVAAEFLVPAAALQGYAPGLDDVPATLRQLASRFKVSGLVALRRIYDLKLLSYKQYHEEFAAELERVLALIDKGSAALGGGNFYNTQPVRMGKRFTRALIESTLEGQTLRRDAFRMLGFKKSSTFDELAVHVGVR